MGVEPGLAVGGKGDVGIGVGVIVGAGEVCGVVEGVDGGVAGVCGVGVVGVVVVAGVGEGCAPPEVEGSRTIGTGTTSPVRIPARRWTVSPGS